MDGRLPKDTATDGPRHEPPSRGGNVRCARP